MAAPSGTVWGSIVGGYGKIGIYKSLSTTDTTATATVEVWFWSKYSVTDSNNTLYYNNLSSSGSATTSQGTVSVKTTVASGSGWSTSNQVKLGSFPTSYARTTSAQTRYLYAKLANIDRVGGTMYASTTFTVPALEACTVSYDANGGSGAPASQTKYYGKTLTLSSVKPTRTGYSFQGWATSKNATTATYAAGGSYTDNEKLTLYAVWKANTYTVSYNANGGTGAPSSQTKTYGVTLTLSATEPTRTNYNFLGWSTSKNATTATYAAGGSYTTNANATLYAIWELAYVKPRISNFKVFRCSADDDSIDDAGTGFGYSFDWATDRDIQDITLTWSPDIEYHDSYTVPESAMSYVSETSGSCYEQGALIGFSTETTYTFTLRVTDANGYSVAFATLSGMNYVIDFKAGGKGVAFNKPAELDDVLDVNLQAHFRKGILPVVLEPETDLNDVRTPNTYTGANISSYDYYNCPVTNGTFTLLVEYCGEDGQVKQTYTSCSKYKPEVYSRFYYTGGTSDESEYWGDWFWASTDEVLLYENSDGSAGTITLKLNGTGSVTAASHYRYLEIYFTDNNGKGSGYTKVWNPNNAVIHLGLQEAGSTVYYRQTAYAITGTTIAPTLDTASYVKVTQSGVVSTSFGTNYIKIVRVVGRA